MKKKGPYNSLKHFLKALILIGIIACVVPFFLKGRDDQPLLKPQDLKLPDLTPPKPSEIKIPDLKGSRQPVKIYKWKDKSGVWHFSDKKNPDVEAEVILVVPERRQGRESGNLPVATPPPESVSDDAAPHIPFPMTISPAEALKLRQDAEKIKVELEKRYEEMNKQLGGKLD